jgi:beta-fructofuranosidase
MIELEIDWAPGTANVGLLLRASETLDAYYQLRLEPASQRVVFDRWPRPGDQPFVIERPLALRPGEPVRLRVLVDGTCAVTYANDEVALSCRMYDHRRGQLGLFVAEGEATYRHVIVRRG